MVTPDDVIGASQPSQGAFFLLVPDSDYIESAIQALEKVRLMFEDSEGRQLGSVYHSMPRSVFLTPEYLEAVSRLGPNVKHVLDCPDSNLPTLARSKANFLMEKIALVCPLLFPGAKLGE